jgi:hypothetical protein
MNLIYKYTYMDLYIFSPFGPICWFCRRVLTKSNGNTHETPMTPAIPPFMIFGTSLKIGKNYSLMFNMYCLLAIVRTIRIKSKGSKAQTQVTRFAHIGLVWQQTNSKATVSNICRANTKNFIANICAPTCHRQLSETSEATLFFDKSTILQNICVVDWQAVDMR